MIAIFWHILVFLKVMMSGDLKYILYKGLKQLQHSHNTLCFLLLVTIVTLRSWPPFDCVHALGTAGQSSKNQL